MQYPLPSVVASFTSDMLSADLGGIIGRVMAVILGSVVI
jgi:hypothetical protein